MEINTNIICVVVTYNRIDKLKKALRSYENQIRLPNKIIVVDNNSTDGTTEYLMKWKEKEDNLKKEVIYSHTNLGGAGGFKLGIERALKEECDWIFVSDDDAYLEEKLLYNLDIHINKCNSDIGAICATVYEHEKIKLKHRRRIKEGIFFIKEIDIPEIEYKKDQVLVSEYSFVGTAIKRDALLEIGLPKGDFFIWYDDTEHSVRMSKRYKIILCSDMRVIHDVESVGGETISWKRYYGYRNFLYMIKYNYGVRYYKNAVRLLILSCLRDILIRRKRVIGIKFDAIKDVERGVLGMSKKYRPGTKI